MLKDLFKLIRPWQWIKNGVVLAGLIFAGEASNGAQVLLALEALAAFCLLSSAVYVLNDIADRERDRSHPLKKNRPLASGRVSPATASIIGLIFSAGGLILVRALGGAVAINVEFSSWLLIATFVLALFLGFGKRRHELISLEKAATSHRQILEKYSPYLLDQLIGIVTASTVVTYLFYTLSPEVSIKLGTEYLYVTIPFVIYGIFRYLYLVHKEEKGGSPTRLLLTDLPLLLDVLLWLASVILILYIL
jgi:4-hydroxybenzoate polyprenyltransferase